jgi:hypothetical protein
MIDDGRQQSRLLRAGTGSYLPRAARRCSLACFSKVKVSDQRMTLGISPHLKIPHDITVSFHLVSKTSDVED